MGFHMGKTIGLMVYWFNGLMGFPLGKTKPFFRIVGTKATEYRGGDTLPPIYIYIYISQIPAWTLWVGAVGFRVGGLGCRLSG